MLSLAAKGCAASSDGLLEGEFGIVAGG